MSFSLLFWILMLFWLLGYFYRGPIVWGFGLVPDMLLFILLGLLGWHAFGAPIHG